MERGAKMAIDYSYTMEDFYGDECKITVYADGTATAETFWTRKAFCIEDRAYDWAYRRGFRE